MFCGLLVWASSASAHHALQAQFNTLKPLQLKGTLARIDWVNPHAYFWLDIKDETGKATQWGCETVGPNALRQAGFLRGPASFRTGETYTFEGFAAIDGSRQDLHDGRALSGRQEDPALVRGSERRSAGALRHRVG